MAITRISGMVSGFDTDTMIKDLMKLEQSKVDKVKKSKQLLTWQKDSYKEFSSLLRGLQSEFLDVVKPSSNLRSKAAFNVFSGSVTLNGATSSAVTVKTSAESQKGTIRIDEIKQLATADTWISSADVKTLEGTVVDFAAIPAGQAISFTVDGKTKSISLDGNYATFEALQVDFRGKLDLAFGAGKVTVGENSAVPGGLSFDSVGSTVSISGDFADELGFTSGDSNVLSTSSTLASAFGIATDPVFTINGVSSTTMGIKSTDTIKQMMDKINSSAAGVQMTYSSISNGFTMKSTYEGAANNIELTDTGSFFANSLKLSTGNRVGGSDAILTVDGIEITRSSNTFTVDGTTLTLKQTYTPVDPASAADIEIDISADTANAMATIKGFVEKYNELIDKITLKTGEKKNRDYEPLTDEEKEALSEKEIELWEGKAKAGLLRSDSTLNGLADKLRSALFDSVEGLGITMRDIGITTSSSYTDRGKLVIDETKLTTALTERPNEVIELFTKESDTKYTDATNRATRDAENGWANKVNDIINDHIRITRDSGGQRGLLIEKAGNERDDGEITSTIAKQIIGMDDRIADLLDDLASKEERYYAQFATMESMLSQMNSQFASVFGSMTGASG